MDFLQNILNNTDTPIWYAFILGLMTAISPCPLATNITAMGFISKDISSKQRVFINGILYTIGRAISYITLGIILYFGSNTINIASIFREYGEKLLGPILVIIGILMLDIINIKFPSFSNLNIISEKLFNPEKKSSILTPLIMGIIFALAFCPYSGTMYFGILIPMTITNPSGLILLLVFAIATGLPVIVFAYLIAFAISNVAKTYNKIKIFELWFRRIISFLFIIVGFYYIYLSLL